MILVKAFFCQCVGTSKCNICWEQVNATCVPSLDGKSLHLTFQFTSVIRIWKSFPNSLTNRWSCTKIGNRSRIIAGKKEQSCQNTIPDSVRSCLNTSKPYPANTSRPAISEIILKAGVKTDISYAGLGFISLSGEGEIELKYFSKIKVVIRKAIF